MHLIDITGGHLTHTHIPYTIPLINVHQGMVPHTYTIPLINVHQDRAPHTYTYPIQCPSNKCASYDLLVKNGVPQGSVLGPILFNLFINDCPLEVNNTILLYADDTKLFTKTNSATDLQYDLDKLQDWSCNLQDADEIPP